MGVVGHGLGEGMDGAGGWYAWVAKPGAVGHMSGDAGALPACKVMTPDHTAFLVRSCDWVKLELVGLAGKALARDITRRIRFIVQAAG